MAAKLKVLFLCTGNSCRSQIAEGWAKKLKKDTIEAFSAEVEIYGLNPDAVRVMAEAGIDISGHTSKHVNDFKDVTFDLVITVCGHAHETCPYFSPRCRVIHVGFDDPPELARDLAQKGASKEKQVDCYRRVRDEIKLFVKGLPDNLKK